mmetsp:Transcript_34023/g.36754  ORF Transcript_34023/g.36754 Transcript_34023/m.36754 type:complete len:245 (-) Transcript_34023:226-960(-)
MSRICWLKISLSDSGRVVLYNLSRDTMQGHVGCSPIHSIVLFYFLVHHWLDVAAVHDIRPKKIFHSTRYFLAVMQQYSGRWLSEDAAHAGDALNRKLRCGIRITFPLKKTCGTPRIIPIQVDIQCIHGTFVIVFPVGGVNVNPKLISILVLCQSEIVVEPYSLPLIIIIFSLLILPSLPVVRNSDPSRYDVLQTLPHSTGKTRVDCDEACVSSVRLFIRSITEAIVLRRLDQALTFGQGEQFMN